MTELEELNDPKKLDDLMENINTNSQLWIMKLAGLLGLLKK